MSLTEEKTSAPVGLPGDPAADAAPAARRVLLVWDAPNLDMGLGSILGRRPTATERPRLPEIVRIDDPRLVHVAEVSPGDRHVAVVVARNDGDDRRNDDLAPLLRRHPRHGLGRNRRQRAGP